MERLNVGKFFFQPIKIECSKSQKNCSNLKASKQIQAININTDRLEKLQMLEFSSIARIRRSVKNLNLREF